MNRVLIVHIPQKSVMRYEQLEIKYNDCTLNSSFTVAACTYVSLLIVIGLVGLYLYDKIFVFLLIESNIFD